MHKITIYKPSYYKSVKISTRLNSLVFWDIFLYYISNGWTHDLNSSSAWLAGL